MLYNRSFEGNRFKVFINTTTSNLFTTFTIPAGVTSIIVTMVGAGGGGGIGFTSYGGGGGGSGGALKVKATVTPGDIYNISVPLGGKGENGYTTTPTGNTGLYPQASFFDSAVAYSGVNGQIGDGFYPGNGGTGGSYFASPFWTVLDFANGNNGASAGLTSGGNGGAFSTFYGIAGTFGPGDTTGSATQVAMSASGFGAGGGGSYNRTTGVDDTAGSGANGYLVITW